MQQIVFEKVKNIINPYLEYSCEISMESCFYNELSINSVDLLNIITDIEDTFKIQVNEDHISKIREVKDVVQLIMDIV